MIRSRQKGARKLNFFWQPCQCTNAEYQREAEVSISNNKLEQEHLAVCLVAQSSSSCGTSLGLPKAPTGRIQATAFCILFKLKHSSSQQVFWHEKLAFRASAFSHAIFIFFFFPSFLHVPCSPAPLLVQQTRSQRAVLILMYFSSKGREKQRRTSIVLAEHNGSLKKKNKRPGPSTSLCHRTAADKNGFTMTQLPWAKTFVPALPRPFAASSSWPGGFMGLTLAGEGPHNPKNLLALLLLHCQGLCALLRARTHTCRQPLGPHKEKPGRVAVKVTQR